VIRSLTRRPAVRRTAAVIGVVAGAYVLRTLIPIVIWRSRWRPAIDALRLYMKRFGNVKEVQRAGTPRSRTTAVHHIGRSSGRGYVTPVWAERVGDRFYIHLPYGTRTDWCRNVVAAGGCVLMHDGSRYETTAPALLPAAEARPLLSPSTRKMQQLINAEFYLRLDIVHTDG